MEHNIELFFDQKKKFYLLQSIADETKRALKKHWDGFNLWCKNNNRQDFPCSADTLSDYLIFRSESGVKNSTIEQLKWAIDFRHRADGLPMPGSSTLVKGVLRGIKRTNRQRPQQKLALTPDLYKNLKLDDSMIGIRERLILTLGFAGALRRSEMCNLRIEDVEITSNGIRLNFQFSKTNQEGKKESVYILRATNSTFCPVIALNKWISRSGLTEGFLLRRIYKSGKLGKKLSTVSVGLIVKNAVKKLGQDASKFGGHSLRAGFATYALEKKVPLNIVARHLRHKKLETTLSYDRSSLNDAFKDLY